MINLRKLFDFQEECIEYLIDTVLDENSKQLIKIKAPTGSGKTITMIGFIEKYIEQVDKNTAFIWMCPGNGNLEEQSREKMCKHSNYKTQNLKDALVDGFESSTTTFINWELVTKNSNNALKDTEKRNLYSSIIEAHNKGIEFLIIIDEEHSHDTDNAREIIDLFGAIKEIRLSATPMKSELCEWYEIDEVKVINEGLITQAISVNEGVEDGIDLARDYDTLIDLAEKKRSKIAEAYLTLGKGIRPLVLIQFPSGQKETIQLVEKKLREEYNYTVENGMVAVWMSERKEDIPKNISDNNGTPIYLLMKQAISTGWDCPRAKVLVKLREGGTESFQIQTVGRIRRMPEPEIGHYGNKLLDYSYVYTVDEKFKEGLLGDNNRAYEMRNLELKKEYEGFCLNKEIKNESYGVGELEILKKVFNYMKSKYDLNKEGIDNKTLLDGGDYRFGCVVHGYTIKGVFVESSKLVSVDRKEKIKTQYVATSSNSGLQFTHVVHKINAVTRIDSRKVRTILDNLFWIKEQDYKRYKVLNLETSEYYAFIINNEELLVKLFLAVSMQTYEQMVLQFELEEPLKFEFQHYESYKFDITKDTQKILINNVYSGYTDGFCNSRTRSKSERLFEGFCYNNPDIIKWFYKNGDVGQDYLSIIYFNGFGEQCLFYPDYILETTNGEIWIIETKGGETDGNNNNIDRQIANKFEGLRRYAIKYKVNWGFVREKDSTQLFINNTEFNEDMSDEHWVPIEEEFTIFSEEESI